MERQAVQMVGLVNDLLDVSRISSMKAILSGSDFATHHGNEVKKELLEGGGCTARMRFTFGPTLRYPGCSWGLLFLVPEKLRRFFLRGLI